MKLNLSGMAFLVAELTKSEMFAIYLMGFDKEMPDQVTKADLVKIIRVLCKKLDWIEVDKVEAVATKSGDEITVSSLNVSRIYEQTNDLSPETELIGENSLFGSETANNDLENDRNVSANEEESLATEVLASSEKMDIDSNVLSQHCTNYFLG